MIELNAVSRDFGDFRIDDITVVFKRGLYSVILGPSGAGKTMLLELIAGFHIPDSGTIAINGTDVTNMSISDRKIGFVYQDIMLFPHMTVEKNIFYPVRYSHIDRDRVMGYVSELGIEDMLERRPGTLSGGEAQRVAIARALASGADTLLLDEPLSSVDPQARTELRRMLRRIQKKYKLTVLHVTHSREEAIYLGDRIYIMNCGKIVQSGMVDYVFRNPVDSTIAELLGHANILEGEGKGAYVDVSGLHLYVGRETRGRCRLLIRPEDIILSRTKVSSSARNVIPGKVISLDRQFRGVLLGLLLDSKAKDKVVLKIFLTSGSAEALAVRKGKRYYAVFKANSVKVLE